MSFEGRPAVPAVGLDVDVGEGGKKGLRLIRRHVTLGDYFCHFLRWTRPGEEQAGRD